MVQYSTGLNARISRSRSTMQPQRDGLHAAGGEPLLDRLPEHRARLVADEPVEHAARLLRLDLLARRCRRRCAIARWTASFVISWKSTRTARGAPRFALDLLGDVPRDRLTFAIRVGRDEDLARVLRGALELGERLLLPGDRARTRARSRCRCRCRASSRADRGRDRRSPARGSRGRGTCRSSSPWPATRR